jgi:hypothetical protein
VPATPEITPNNGRTIPQLGFGVFQVRPEDTVEDLEAITSLNRDQRTGPDPDKFDAV